MLLPLSLRAGRAALVAGALAAAAPAAATVTYMFEVFSPVDSFTGSFKVTLPGFATPLQMIPLLSRRAAL